MLNKIAIIGLGYVGLPLAYAFSEKYSVIGFDISENRIAELKNTIDNTRELSPIQVKEAIDNGIIFTNKKQNLKDCNIYIITVPTPIDRYKKPDISYLKKASTLVGEFLNDNDIVIYESTVYPGCTEEDCVPVLEQVSGLIFNKNFYCGYSPERINPGDKKHTIKNILKVTSGSTPKIAEFIDKLYSSIITAGTYRASSIKVAEAAKVIENTQRDVNISLINELALIFDKIGIDTLDVLEAAGTKWNFLPFRPGIVGGHCISVDPYYLSFKAESLGYKPQIIQSGRTINDNMGIYIANKVIKLMVVNNLKIKGAKVLLLGITFKENCPDIRNSRVIDIYDELKSFGIDIDVYDPYANPDEVKHEYNFEMTSKLSNDYNAIILAVGHHEFLKLNFENLKKSKKSIIYDVKSILPRDIIDDRL